MISKKREGIELTFHVIKVIMFIAKIYFVVYYVFLMIGH